MSNTETTKTDGGVGGGGSGGGEDHMFKRIHQVIDELYETCNNFSYENPLDKTAKTEELYNIALQLLDSIPIENRNAMYEYLRGKVLDCTPNHSKEAEEHLCKAVKLNSSIGDAWLSLGSCIWKREDLMAAKSCMVLALNKSPNKMILCQLSLLEGEIAQDGKVAEVLKESIKHAREALAMDVTDGLSWYCLGNALLRSYMLTGGWNLRDLRESLRAYENAERDVKLKYYPFLRFNSAIVNEYFENYERALSGYEAAASIEYADNPFLNSNNEIQNMVELFDAMESLSISHSRCKGLLNLVNAGKTSLELELDAVKLNPPYRRATLDTLREGVNKAFEIIGKVLGMVPNKNSSPRYYSLCDSNFKLCLLSVYGSHADDAIKSEDIVTILDPCYRHQDFSWKGKRYVFESIRVDTFEQVRVNEVASSPEQTEHHEPL